MFEGNAEQRLRHTRLVWDFPVRVAHWLLVISIAGCYVTSRFTYEFTWHKYCGYAVLVLATFRSIWGLLGTRHARFSHFVVGPKQVWHYLSTMWVKTNTQISVGHNPLGGWSIVAMLVLMIAQAGTGLFANDEIANVGPLYGWVADPVSTGFTSAHHIIFKGIAALVALHIVAIAFYGCVLKTNLLTPMVTGRKPAQWVPESQAIGNSRTWLAILIILILVSILAAIVTSAPRASLSIF